MQKRSVYHALVAAALVVTGLTGCTTSPGTATVVGGTAVGAGTGAAIGALAGGGEGAAIGALAGAVLGAGTGVVANEVNKGKTAYPVADRCNKDPRYVNSPFDRSRLWVGGAPTGQRLRDPQGRVFIVGD